MSSVLSGASASSLAATVAGARLDATLTREAGQIAGRAVTALLFYNPP